MKVINIIPVALISLAIGAFLSFDSTSLTSLAVASIIQVVLITYFCITAYRTVKNFNSLGYKKIGLKLLLLTLLVCGIAFTYFANSVTSVISGIGIPHLRMNVLTGECGLNKYTDRLDFWYFERGCDLPTVDKIALLKKDERVIRICSDPRNYETYQRDYWDEVTCEDIFK